MSAYDEAQKIDASKGWYANRQHFEAAAIAIVSPWKTFYDASPPAARAEIVAAAGDYVGGKFVEWDAQFDWDFPHMSDRTEDYFLYAYGYAKARHVLTGQLKLL